MAAFKDGRDGVRFPSVVKTSIGSANRGIWFTEELTPVRLDWTSAVPLATTALGLPAPPKLAAMLARGGWGAHLLDAASIRQIERADFG